MGADDGRNDGRRVQTHPVMREEGSVMGTLVIGQGESRWYPGQTHRKLVSGGFLWIHANWLTAMGVRGQLISRVYGVIGVRSVDGATSVKLEPQ